SMPVPDVAPRSVAHPEIRKPADETVARFDGVSMVHVGREPGGGGGGVGPGRRAGPAPDAVPATSCTAAFVKSGAVVTSQFGSLVLAAIVGWKLPFAPPAVRGEPC